MDLNILEIMLIHESASQILFTLRNKYLDIHDSICLGETHKVPDLLEEADVTHIAFQNITPSPPLAKLVFKVSSGFATFSRFFSMAMALHHKLQAKKWTELTCIACSTKLEKTNHNRSYMSQFCSKCSFELMDPKHQLFHLETFFKNLVDVLNYHGCYAQSMTVEKYFNNYLHCTGQIACFPTFVKEE